MSLSSIMNRFHILFRGFYHWLWTNKCRVASPSKGNNKNIWLVIDDSLLVSLILTLNTYYTKFSSSVFWFQLFLRLHEEFFLKTSSQITGNFEQLFCIDLCKKFPAFLVSASKLPQYFRFSMKTLPPFHLSGFIDKFNP